MANDAVHIRLNNGVPTLYDVYGNVLGTLAALAQAGVTPVTASVLQAVTRTNDGNYATTNTTFAVIHASRFDLSFTLAIDDKILFFFSASATADLTRLLSLDIEDGASRVTANDGGITGNYIPNGLQTSVGFTYLYTASVAGVHTFRPVSKTNAGTVTILNAVSGDAETQITFGGLKI